MIHISQVLRAGPKAWALLIKGNQCLLKQLLLVFLNHYEECHISIFFSGHQGLLTGWRVRETGDRVWGLCQLSISGKSYGTKAPTAPLPALATGSELLNRSFFLGLLTLLLLSPSSPPFVAWVSTAVYLNNRFPTPVLNNRSPYEVLFGSVPYYVGLPLSPRANKGRLWMYRMHLLRRPTIYHIRGCGLPWKE